MDAVIQHEPHVPPPVAHPGRGRRTLPMLALVCVLPVLASYLSFHLWPPSGRVNHGVLLPPTPLPAVTLAGAGGQPELVRDELLGRWTLVHAAPAACPPECVAALYLMRQARLAQGKEQDRVARLWLLAGPDAAGAELAAEPGLRLARVAPAWLAALPATAGETAVFLVDPLGNVMMRFAVPAAGRADEATTAAVRGVIKDLERLLKYSALGRGAPRGVQE